MGRYRVNNNTWGEKSGSGWSCTWDTHRSGDTVGGSAGPLGTERQTFSLEGTTWDLYVGNIGWNVCSFIRTSGTSDADLDLNAFLQALARRGLVQRTDWLSSVEAGTEAFTGRARLDTESYSTTVG